MLAWSSRMDKKAALKKEEEKKSLQLTLLQKQILQALYAHALFKSQQYFIYRKKLKKYKRALFRRKKQHLQKQHMMHLQYECYVLHQAPKPTPQLNLKPRPELLIKYCLFSKPKVVSNAPKVHFVCYM